jgi:hypothetical protein
MTLGGQPHCGMQSPGPTSQCPSQWNLRVPLHLAGCSSLVQVKVRPRVLREHCPTGWGSSQRGNEGPVPCAGPSPGHHSSTPRSCLHNKSTEPPNHDPLRRTLPSQYAAAPLQRWQASPQTSVVGWFPRSWSPLHATPTGTLPNQLT